MSLSCLIKLRLCFYSIAGTFQVAKDEQRKDIWLHGGLHSTVDSILASQLAALGLILAIFFNWMLSRFINSALLRESEQCKA